MLLRIHSKRLMCLGLLSVGLVTVACRPKAALVPPPPKVGTVALQAERLVLTTELPGPHFSLPCRRDPPPSQRHHPEAPFPGGCRC